MIDVGENIFDLNGRVAFVTGAGSGLGRHFATVLAGAGARVVIGGRRIDKLAETVGMIEDAGDEVRVVEVDVSDETGVRRAPAGSE